MKTANYYHLHDVIGALNTLSDDLCAEYVTIDKDDNESIKNVLYQIVRPRFLELSNRSQEKCKDSMRFFLTTKTAPFDDILSAQQESPLESPSEPINFFVWLWEVLFPGDSFELESLDGWVVDNNSTENGLCLKGYD